MFFLQARRNGAAAKRFFKSSTNASLCVLEICCSLIESDFSLIRGVLKLICQRPIVAWQD